ncbi:hypothetical protein Gpo141_00011403 [Globisporangium polare]
MTHGNSHKALLQPPTAIDTSLRLWGDLAIPQCVNGEDHRDSRWQQKQSLGRRTKSHSPSRRSPKLRHTNGRLNGDPSRGDNKQQLLARLQPTPVVPIRPVQQEKDRPEAIIPKRSGLRRSITCASHGKTQLECATPRTTSPTRLKICYRDEALRVRSAENTRRMIVNARQKLSNSGNGSGGVSPQTSTEPAAVDGFSENAPTRITSNQQKLALKALKYRNLLARTNEIDDDRLRDPSFDVLECLGVKWCKV